MTYEKVKNLKPEEFKRLCGVNPETFDQMTSARAIALKNQAENRTTWVPEPGRPIIDDMRILEGVPHILSYRPILGSERVNSISYYP